MNIWRNFTFHSSPVETILDRGNCTLEELFDEEDIIQEVKGQKRKLIEFLTKPESLNRMIAFVSKPPKDPYDYKHRVRYPSVACEVLCSDVWLICETIYENEELLDQLYSFLDEPLHPSISAFSSRVAIALLQKKTTETFEYYKERDTLDKILRNLKNPSVLELLLKIISCEETIEGRSNGILEILSEKNLITNLVTTLIQSEEEDVHETISQALTEIIAISTNSPLMQQLESGGLLNGLFDHLLRPETSSSAFENGMNVLIEILKRNSNDNGSARVPSPILVSIEHVQHFVRILVDEKDMASVMTSTGELNPPFGLRRMKVLQFLVALLKTNYRVVDDGFLLHDVILIGLNLFFQYPWNNFLHASVETMIETILDSENEDLKLQLFTRYRITDRLIEASSFNDRESTKPQGRQGYMGFVTNISVMIDKAAERNPTLNQFLSGNPSWKDYLMGPVATTLNLQRRFVAEEGSNEDYGFSENNTEDQNDAPYNVPSPFVNDFPDEFEYDDPFEEEELKFDVEKPFDGGFSTDERKFSQEVDDLDETDSSADGSQGDEDQIGDDF
eukprot:TRINITY_DN7813_c0_g1_i1.p1 TRINITY_DN7813_c0_g1~~TRINITY_DN7813_c0_g1_i1.p1  ORF type:complete len:562 (+),score=96.70 TRINITY_DN7813_c0_g1_i1:90-1775(+)